MKKWILAGLAVTLLCLKLMDSGARPEGEPREAGETAPSAPTAALPKPAITPERALAARAEAVSAPPAEAPPAPLASDENRDALLAEKSLGGTVDEFDRRDFPGRRELGLAASELMQVIERSPLPYERKKALQFELNQKLTTMLERLDEAEGEML
jgi:hypothetical protein